MIASMNSIYPPFRTLSVILAVVLGGCGTLTHTPYTAPETTASTQWQYGNSQPARTDQWWTQFHDPELDALISEVLERNNNLSAAGFSVRRAWLEAGLAADAERPVLSASVSSTGEKNLKGSNNDTTQKHSATLGVSYEVDLWGKLSNARDAAEWEARATEQDRSNTAWTLVGTTARLYWKLAYLNQRLTLAQENVDYAQRTLKIAQVRHDAGAVSGLDVIEAEQTLASLQATFSTVLQSLVETRNAIAVLLDSAPGRSLPNPSRLPDTTLPEVPAGIPAELLGRRPDLQAAELRLRSTLASGDATRASYYPSISLTGSLGGTSTALSNLLSNPVGTLGAGLALPFLQWNEMQLSIKVAKIDYEKAVINFRQTLYEAMADVENALSARTQYARQQALLVRSLELARESERRYEVQYRSGAVSLKSWLDAQKTRREADLTLAATRYNQFDNLVTLYQALGGTLPLTDM